MVAFMLGDVHFVMLFIYRLYYIFILYICMYVCLFFV